MKTLVLAALLVVSATAMQPVIAANAAAPHLCAKGAKVCACGKLPAAMWQCCSANTKCNCAGGLPDCKHG